MEIIKISLFLSIFTLCSAYADRQTVDLTYVESIDEYDDFDLGVELRTMESVVDDLEAKRSYQFGKRKRGKT